jgi:DinB family protein
MQDYVARLLTAIDDATPRLMNLDDEASARRPAPNKWSPREIVGHLIDSASNNHQRFVRAQFTDDLIFPGYEQDRWVEVQQYREVPWLELVALWAAFNRHIARVMTAAPESARMKPRRAHNLHQLAWKPIPESEPATLDDFMRDYVAHLEHHIKQILGRDWSPADQGRS